MKRFAALIAIVLFAACASTHKDDDDLPQVPVPPPDKTPVAQAPAPDERIAQMQTQMTELLERLDVLNARIAKLEAAQAQPPAAVTAAAPVPAPTPATAALEHPRQQDSITRSADIADAYKNALMLYGRGRHADARAAFQKVFDADPNGELADNALYWIGETYFVAGDYSNAMRYYERVTKEYGDQNKAPDAMFKMALAYIRTGDVAMAKKTLEECIQKYPYSTPAAAAKFELKRIKY